VDGNNSIPGGTITANNKAIESKQQGQHVPRVGFSIKQAIIEREATQTIHTTPHNNKPLVKERESNGAVVKQQNNYKTITTRIKLRRTDIHLLSFTGVVVCGCIPRR
jgi:hypothetical protein